MDIDINADEVDINMSDLTVTELKEMAKEKGIEGYSKLKKEELLMALSEV